MTTGGPDSQVRTRTSRPGWSGQNAAASSSSPPTTLALTYQVMTESELDKHIRRLCKDLGLRAYHTHDSRRSPAGFPDLVLVGPNGILFAELKSVTGKLRPEQAEWRDALTEAGQTWLLWRPDGLADGTIAAALAAISYMLNRTGQPRS